MRLYFKNGVEITDNDVMFLRHKDVVYLDLLGRKFNEAQLLDQYTKVSQILSWDTYTVYTIMDKDSQELFVLKTIDFEDLENCETKIDEFWRKLKIIQNLEHRNAAK